MSETRRLPRSLLVRTSAELGSAIDAAAAQDGLTSAAWVRRLAASTLESGRVSDVQRSPRRVARPQLVGAEIELRAMVRDLGRLAGASIQLAKALREDKRSEHLAAEEVLAEVRQAAAKASSLVDRLK